MKTLLRATLAVALAALLITVCTVGGPGEAQAGSLFLSSNLNNQLDPNPYGLVPAPGFPAAGYDGNYDETFVWTPGYGIKNSLGLSFKTGIQSYALDSVVVDVYGTSNTALQLALYRNSGGIPGNTGLPSTLVTTLSLQGNLPTAPDPLGTALRTTFTAPGITLDSGSYYWIVLTPLIANGDVFWGMPLDKVNGDGVGFQPGYAVMYAGQSDWGFSGPNAIYRMEIDATAVPVPPTLLLIGTGLLTMVGLRRRKKV